jgi:hypothetical protein
METRPPWTARVVPKTWLTVALPRKKLDASVICSDREISISLEITAFCAYRCYLGVRLVMDSFAAG